MKPCATSSSRQRACGLRFTCVGSSYPTHRVPDSACPRPARSGPRWVGFDDPTHVNLKPHARWRELLVAHGFAVVREGSDGLWNVPYGAAPWPGDAVRAAPAFAQYLAGRLVLPPGAGESAVFVVERSGND